MDGGAEKVYEEALEKCKGHAEVSYSAARYYLEQVSELQHHIKAVFSLKNRRAGIVKIDGKSTKALKFCKGKIILWPLTNFRKEIYNFRKYA